MDAESLHVRVPSSTLTALDDWIDEQKPRPTRPEAIRLALRDWLTGRGRLKQRDDRESEN